MTETVKVYGEKSATAELEPLSIELRNTGDEDVKIEIKYCGVCHSDMHTVRNDWKGSTYPVIPGY